MEAFAHSLQTGWMMWNYVVAVLSCGSRVVLYDGSPLHPTPAFQVELLEQQGYALRKDSKGNTDQGTV